MKAIVHDRYGTPEVLELGEIDMPVVDRTYPLAEAPEAIRSLAEGHAREEVVITV